MTWRRIRLLAAKGHVRAAPARQRTSRQTEASSYAKDWFQMFTVKFGDNVPHRDEVWVAATSFKEIHQRYQQHCQVQNIESLGYHGFNQMRAQHFPFVLVHPNKDFFRCSTCDNLDNRIASAQVTISCL